MIKKICIIIVSFLIYHLHAQIKMDFSVDKSTKKAFVRIINESEKSLIIPIDIISLRPNFNDVCLDVSQHTYQYPTLGLNVKVKNDNGQLVESSAGSVMINDIKEAKIIFNKITLENKKYEKEIRLWQKRHGIKSFNDAKINYYIFNNLRYLKPGEMFEKEFYFDLHNITNGKYMYYYYHIEDDRQYDISLSFNIEDCVYEYLTEKQKQSLNKYNLFTGEIESNKIELKY